MKSTVKKFRLIWLFALATLLSPQAFSAPISIMTFNVENLFDASHDAGKNDETYLPASKKKSSAHIEKCKKISVRRWRDQCLYWDWSEAVVDRKLRGVSDAIKHVNGGQGPDIIALQEVENIGILERLRTDYLTGLGYQPAVLLEGKDTRGIDVAFLSKLPVTEAKLHPITFPKSLKKRAGDTRPILETSFELPNGETLTGFSVHFPAPYHPTEMREVAYTKLNKMVAALPDNQAVFAAGDFNTTLEEDTKKDMLERWVRPTWQVAHDLCEACPGTSYYPPKDDWSFLDMVLWRNTPGWKMTGSFLANQTSEQVLPNGTPKRFQLPEASGVSDHWPLVMVVETTD
jgi:endonuclease/exonuclease/phosphatase family metal-dependent hydrolase